MPTTVQAIGLPFTQANEYFRQKINMPSAHWTAVMDEAHSRSFAVAGAMKDGLVEDFRQAVHKAIAKGTGLQEFRKDFDGIVKKHGWSHTGTANWRAQIIYRTNMANAFAAGRYAQMTNPAVLAAFPYWEYIHVSCLDPRPQHVAWSGTVLRADDPFWATCYPPNGWGCHCIVGTVSEGGLSRMGKTAPDASPKLEWRDYENRSTGVVTKYPAGVDPGFAYNPGKAWQDRAAQPVKAPDVKPVGVAPPVLAPTGEARVKDDVLEAFLDSPAQDSVQIGELVSPHSEEKMPVVLAADAVKAARKAGVTLDAAVVTEIARGVGDAQSTPRTPYARSVVVRGLRLRLHWSAEQGCWAVVRILRDKS